MRRIIVIMMSIAMLLSGFTLPHKVHAEEPKGYEINGNRVCGNSVYEGYGETAKYLGYWAFYDDGTLLLRDFKDFDDWAFVDMAGDFSHEILDYNYSYRRTFYDYYVTRYDYPCVKRIIFDEGTTSVSSRFNCEDPNEAWTDDYDDFYTFSNLESVEFPSSLTSIDGHAFSGCKKLSSIILRDGIKKIGDSAFANTGLSSVQFPESLQSISSCAFSFCKNLKNVVFQEGLNDIGFRAFDNTGLTSVQFPSSLTSIDRDAFSECKNLKNVVFQEGLLDIGKYAFSDTGLTSVQFPKTLSSIKEYAFSGSVNLKNVVFQEGITDIGKFAFNNTSISNVVLPSTITKLGERCFDNNSFQTIYIPNVQEASFETITKGAGVNTWWVSGKVPYVDVYYGGSKDSFNKACKNPGCIRKIYYNTSYDSYLERLNDEKTTIDFSKMPIFLYYSSTKYSGKEKTPEVAVFDRRKRLTKGKDYIVTYNNNIKGGKATVIAKGIGKYKGSLKKNFTIKRLRPYLKAKNITRPMYFKRSKVRLKVKTNSDASIQYKSNNKRVRVNSKGVVTIPKNYHGTITIRIKVPKTQSCFAKAKRIKIRVKKPKFKYKSIWMYRGEKWKKEKWCCSAG